MSKTSKNATPAVAKASSSSALPVVIKNSTPAAEDERKEEEKKVWLDAWYDPLAAACAMQSSMALVDLNGDGDFKMVIGISGSNPLLKTSTSLPTNRLKVFKGTTLISENVLLEEPVAVCSFYPDYKTPRRPIIAVASGSFIFLYKNLQPFYKFVVPAIEVIKEEKEIWLQLLEKKLEPQVAYDLLSNLREQGASLTNISQEFLSITEPEQLPIFVKERVMLPLVQHNVITCMTVLRKDKEEDDGIGCLVVGTEGRKVLVLDPTGSSVKQSIILPSTPAMIISNGMLDVEYRITVACRNGNVYTIRNGELSGVVIELDSQPCALVRYDKMVAVGTMTNIIHTYQTKGKKNFSIYLPAPIKCMEVMDMKVFRNVKILMVALGNMELRMYNGKNLINTIITNDVVTGMRFGIYGTEPNVLALTYRNGALEFKIIARNAKLETKNESGPPSEQDLPLNLPKKSKLYIEQIEREKQFATEMHRIFQRELCKLRVTTARTVVKILTDGQGTISYTSGSTIRLHAHVQGLGPLYKIRLNLQNTGQKIISNIPVLFTYNPEIYKMKKSRIVIPVLVPSLQYKYSVEVESVEETTGADIIKVFVCNPSSSVPLITATLAMPLPDVFQDQQQ